LVVFLLVLEKVRLGRETRSLLVELLQGLQVIGVNGFGLLLLLLLLGLSTLTFHTFLWVVLMFEWYLFHTDDVPDRLILDNDVGLWAAVVERAGTVARRHGEGKGEALLQIVRWVATEMFLLTAVVSRDDLRLLN
jgi:hypothetical protein